jgi:hypothetical protein
VTLRLDQNQWVIYQEPSVQAAIRAVNIVTSILAGDAMEKHHEMRIRAMGHVAGSLADSQLRYGLGLVEGHDPDEFTRLATEHAVTIISFIKGAESSEASERALDEVHAAVYWLDSRLKAAGITGDGWYRELARKGVGLDGG